MKIEPSTRITSIASYAFSEIDRKVDELKLAGIAPIDFGVGDPQDPPFPSVIARMDAALKEHLTSGYPSYVGHAKFRTEVAAYLARRFGVDIDPQTELISSIGSKELIFNFPEAFINPGDTVLIPNPTYPPYIRGTLFAEGVPFYLDLLEENHFLPDLDAVPQEVWERAKLIWVNYPNNPTAVFAPDEFYEKLLWFAHKHDVLVGSDEAYSENYFASRPRSLLEFGKEGVVSFFSFSKMANMTMFRVGFAAGDERIISVVKKLKTNIDSGTPTFIQIGALAALDDDTALQSMRADYHAKLDILCQALTEKGFPECRPEGTIYIWQRCPEGFDALSLAERFLEPDLGIVVTPGPMLAAGKDQAAAAQHHVRFALTPTVESTRKAAERILACSL